jgi:hypothetical protein
MPSRGDLGWYTQPGDCDAIAHWLNGCPAGHFVVSADMLCYGGLVASRTPAVDAERALERLESLRELRSRRPDAVIFAFSIVMRLGTTVTDAQSLAVHQALGLYSQLLDRVERLGETNLHPELSAVTAQLGTETVAEYLAVRRRNHAVNSAAIRLAADGVIDYLVLAQEDSAPVGIHIPELSALHSQVEEFRLTDRVAIHPGADEVGVVLMARHHTSTSSARIAVEYAAPEGAAVIPRFEHQPISHTVGSQLRAAGARTAVADEADALLVVHTPIGAQTDIAEAPPPGESPALAAQARAIAGRTRAVSSAGMPVGLADLAYCNGADPELIAALTRGGAHHLTAYAGWNTAGNTLGTAIAQLCIAASGAGAVRAAAARDAARDFIACRFTDDYGYQSCVRKLAGERAAAIGANPFMLGDHAARIEQFVRGKLQPFAHAAYSDLLGASGALAERVRVSLPWQRLFEIAVWAETDDSADSPEKNLS